ncbi:hypothetical protein PK35_12315 [Tamlana nanhaiensis]|uniref:Alpha/beta hydrolase n=1 Tax=Neotamlana nanhaiensis TaxID=1382798 RepID=A0A0D7VYL2_9FLAO|nr:hypothetical protein [Tamlana nanhaiensis]KJD31926.1 hypothetical protein PK35_12315 [Tamlana nanhaiensis]
MSAKIISIKTIITCLLIINLNACASTGTWFSGVTNSKIKFKISEAKKPKTDFYGNYLTIVYLENLPFEKIGTISNSKNIAWLVNEGYRVIQLDYNKNPKASATKINKDIIAINKALASNIFCGLPNCSNYKSYILFEGYRIERDVPYFKDNPKIYNTPKAYSSGDMLNMDIIYPVSPKHKTPVVLSFSYSNSYATFNDDLQQLTDAHTNFRTFLPYTFTGFNDTFLTGAPAHGMAWAIADHPKYCPWGSGTPENGKRDTYKSYQTNPDTAQKVKSAVRTLRALGNDFNLSGDIGIYGFSRGSSAGSMAIGDKTVLEFENAGFHQNASDDVQVAALGPGVFDYTQIYNTLNDGDNNLETRCPWAWGDLESNYEHWQKMGSSYLVTSNKTAPTLFFFNTDDDAYYSDQINIFKTKLESFNVPTKTLINYSSGHAVPQDEASLLVLYNFFKLYLHPPQLQASK